jgi:hypothetical protein
MASLRELQRDFAAALRPRDRGSRRVPAVRPLANLDVYRNNTDWQFRHALAVSYPVVQRRVGEDYFRQLGRQYRQRYPSRSGDLHWVGRDFAGFLQEHLAGSEYAWLADLARLEWAREVASIAPVLPHLGHEVLASVPADALEDLVFRLQPSLQLGASEYPVFTVWAANQFENAPRVDQYEGREAYLVLSCVETVEVRLVERPLHLFLSALQGGCQLGEAVARAELDEHSLLRALQFVFTTRLVTGVQ